MSTSIDPSQVFIRSWEIYQKIIQANYMLHQELGIHSQEHLKSIASTQAIRLLDIGCGDAQQISSQLCTINIASYTGYDLSEQAIAFAQKNTEALNTSTLFHVGAMEELIKKDQTTYNVLYSSFAIHHLTDEVKLSFIHDCYSKLESKGIFILIDIKRQPGQSIDEYIKSYSNWIKEEWHLLNQDEIKAIIDHLTTCDIPVETSTYIKYANEAGFVCLEEIDIDSRHAMLVFSKN